MRRAEASPRVAISLKSASAIRAEAFSPSISTARRAARAEGIRASVGMQAPAREGDDRRLALPALRVNGKAKRPAGRPAGRLVQVWIEAAYWAGFGASAARTSTGRPRASSCGLTTAASPTTTQT